jgi:hypothetical protein
LDFEQTHCKFFEHHLARRSGERKGRLARGHNHLEKLFLQNVWWPPFGRFGIECDGFQTHVKEMDREKFDYALNRDNCMMGMGWKMIHFSYDSIQERPEICRMMLKMIIGSYYFSVRKESPLLPQEKEILRMAWISGKPIRPRDISEHYRINFRTSRKRLRALVDNGWLEPITRGGKVLYYELIKAQFEQLL